MNMRYSLLAVAVTLCTAACATTPTPTPTPISRAPTPRQEAAQEGLCKAEAEVAYMAALLRDRGLSERDALANLAAYKELAPRERRLVKAIIQASYANPDATPETAAAVVLTLCTVGRI
jgi:hypothetical protein